MADDRGRTPPAEAATPGPSCSLCGGKYRRCPCPWGKPFDQWTGVPLNTLKAVAGAGGPRPGS